MDQQPSPSAPANAPDVAVGGYQVLGRLAVGGMSELFLAHESADGEVLRYVVIKLLPAAAAHAAQGSSHSEAEDMFLREGRTLLRLDHPNICHSYAFGTTGARCYIAMEWIDGVSLRELLIGLRDQARGLSFALAANLVAQVAAGLEHAHKARDARRAQLHVVHRDVNPTNIMVRYDGVVKLIDFGVAQVAERRPDAVPAAVRGKLAYMAPEQVRGEELDHRADIFALGVCLYELLTGSRLYRRGSAQATAGAVLEEDVPSARTNHPDVPEELDAVVQRALQKDPAARFASAGEMQTALEEYLVRAGQPMGARPLAALMQDVFKGRGGKPEIEELTDLAERFSDPGPLPQSTTARNDTMRPPDESSELVHLTGSAQSIPPAGAQSEHSGLVATERAHVVAVSAPAPRARPLWPWLLVGLAGAVVGVLTFLPANRNSAAVAEPQVLPAAESISASPGAAAVTQLPSVPTPPATRASAPDAPAAAPANSSGAPAPAGAPASSSPAPAPSTPALAPSLPSAAEPAADSGAAATPGASAVPSTERRYRARSLPSSPGFIADPGF